MIHDFALLKDTISDALQIPLETTKILDNLEGTYISQSNIKETSKYFQDISSFFQKYFKPHNIKTNIGETQFRRNIVYLSQKGLPSLKSYI